ncbi:MAG: N-acetylmuramoyl-L-alanine amidase [Planctomycetes bacterium]|nr:N-acetylmuramoyl-L-alanine amidase [Planctomycetota bacterium]
MSTILPHSATPAAGGHRLVRAGTGRRLRCGLAALLATLVGCATRTPASRNAATPPPVLSASYLLAPVRGDAELELAELAADRSPPGRLRRGWIHLQRGRPQEAIDAVAEVLWGADRPSPAAEAWARYIRAESFAALGQPERGAFDRERATELALDPELRRRLPAPEPVAKDAVATPAAGAQVVIQKRSAWQPTPAIAGRMKPMGKIYRLTVHHSALWFRETTTSACAAQLRVIQRSHMQSREYGDVGYHYLIDPAGRVWEGRDIRWQGAHARDHNNVGNIGICLLGNFVRDRQGQRPTDAQVAALRGLVHDLAARHRFGSDAIHCHRDFVQTECPGPNLIPIVQRLAAELRAGTGSGRVAAAAR